MRSWSLLVVMAMILGAPGAFAKNDDKSPAPAKKPTAAATNPDDEVPDITKIPRLAPGLPVGTIAWATSEQLHPTQPQTGSIEVKRKTAMFKAKLVKNGKEFSENLYKFAYKRSVSPVYIGNTPRKDSRYGKFTTLGYITDRTHGSDALSQVILETYGKKALRKPIYDDQGRPLNFILVKVMGDETHLNEADFQDFMIDGKHAYLRDWSRGKHGKTVVTDIAFNQLPETVIKTTDNPYRGFIGDLQHRKLLGRASSDFSQFVLSEALRKNNVVTWDEIAPDAAKEVYDNAIKKAVEFFKSPAARGLPGVDLPPQDDGETDPGSSCENAF